MFFVVLLIGAVTLLYVWLKWNYSYWKRKGVPGPEPSFFVGNLSSVFTFSEHFGLVAEKWYKKYSDEPYVGYYKMLQPAIMARDPDLIKEILSTNFNSFRNNDFKLSKKYDPLTATNPFFNRDDEWKEGRKAISPMLSQSKLKGILPVIHEVSGDFIKYIKSFPIGHDFEAKKLSDRFTTQNVVKCAFSFDAGCFSKEEQENEFLLIGKQIFSPSFLAGMKFFLMPFLPEWLFERIPVSFLPEATDRWFRSLVRTNRESRSKDFQSNDLFQALLQIQEKHKFDETFLAGHSLSFYLDGTETSATTFSYVLYELARHPECQAKLRDEIVTTMAKHNGQLTYEAIQEMSYLECVIFEASRINPPVLFLSKLCNSPYTLPKTSGQTKPVTIGPGTSVQIPILAIHRDPKNYPEPEKFKPERFNEEEQRNRHKTTFLTFGEGPRVCLGMRFAMLQLKVAVIHIILQLRIKVSPKHKPIVIDPQTLLSLPKDGILLNFESR